MEMGRLLATGLGALLIVYVLLQKKWLPKFLWKPLARFYFYPMLLPAFLWRRFVVGGAYFTDVDGSLLLGAVPLQCAGHVKQLHKDGVRAVVNMQDEYEGPQAAYAELSPPIMQFHLPVVDHIEPTVDQLEAAVSYIARHRPTGRVLVHCKGGHGRSAAVAAAWLVSEHGGELTLEEAQGRLSAARKVRKNLYLQPALTQFYRRRVLAKERARS